MFAIIFNLNQLLLWMCTKWIQTTEKKIVREKACIKNKKGEKFKKKLYKR